MDEKKRMELLAEIIDQLQDDKPGRPPRPGHEYHKTPLCHIYAHFKTRRGKDFASLGVVRAMDCLINDVYTFEDFTLQDADSVALAIH